LAARHPRVLHRVLFCQYRFHWLGAAALCLLHTAVLYGLRVPDYVDAQVRVRESHCNCPPTTQ
jgi:hypothetical protein